MENKKLRGRVETTSEIRGIVKDKRQPLLNPTREHEGDQIQINFTQDPIPELFGVVKDEHKVPSLQYQDNKYHT